MIAVGAPKPAVINNINPELRDKGMVVPIGILIYDPDNARLHPERNMQAIKESLNAYGQTGPVIVQRWRDSVQDRRAETQTNHVVAGNGRLQAARELGWTEIAATFIDMTDLQAAGYGLADNRTAELAEWDLKTVARLEQLVAEAGQSVVGWTTEEITALRAEIEPVQSPDEFAEVDENIDVEHVCPKCGYCFSGGEVTIVGEHEGQDGSG